VLVHGWADSWRTWLRVLPLVGNQQRIIAIDQVGFGDSSKPEDPRYYSIARQAQHLRYLLDGLAIGSSIRLVGHSMGSFVAYHFAAFWPHMVDELFLIGTAAQGNTKTVIAGLDTILSTSDLSKRVRDLKFVASAPQWFSQTLVHESLKVPRTIMSYGLQAVVNVTAGDMEALAPNISAKTVIIHGDGDELFSLHDSDKLRPLLTRAASVRLIQVRNASHSVQWEKPGNIVVAGLLESNIHTMNSHSVTKCQMAVGSRSSGTFHKSMAWTSIMVCGAVFSLSFFFVGAMRRFSQRHPSPSDYWDMCDESATCTL